MKLLVALFATIVPVCLAGGASAQSAQPGNPSGFGQSVSGFAQEGLTGDIVRDLATNNAPGTVAEDLASIREAVGGTPTPPGNPRSDD